MSAFGNKIKEILDRIGKNEQWLHEQTGIGKATISEWQSDPNRVPKPSSLDKIVRILVPLGASETELYDAAGYRMVTSKDANNRMERLERLAAAQPRVLAVLEKIARRPPSEQEEIVRLLEAWYATRPRQSPEG